MWEKWLAITQNLNERFFSLFSFFLGLVCVTASLMVLWMEHVSRSIVSLYISSYSVVVCIGGFSSGSTLPMVISSFSPSVTKILLGLEYFFFFWLPCVGVWGSPLVGPCSGHRSLITL